MGEISVKSKCVASTMVILDKPLPVEPIKTACNNILFYNGCVIKRVNNKYVLINHSGFVR